MGKLYQLCGWEYRKPERASPACPYKPVANNESKVEKDSTPSSQHSKPSPKSSGCR